MGKIHLAREKYARVRGETYFEVKCHCVQTWRLFSDYVGCWISYEGKYKVFLFLCILVSALDRLRVLFICVLERSVLGMPWPYY